MANKGPAYGLSRECQLKAMNKFDINLANQAMQWIQDVTGVTVLPDGGAFQDAREVQTVLRDGALLCQLFNSLKPDSIKINSSQLAFKQMENIEKFIRACRDYGMKETDVFQTDDLYNGKNMYIVVNTLHLLGSLARKNGFEGPVIGVKLADKNERNFTDEKLREGDKVVGFQYGSYRGATQTGMTPYGTTRHI